jgi:hypothetical protein
MEQQPDTTVFQSSRKCGDLLEFFRKRRRQPLQFVKLSEEEKTHVQQGSLTFHL